VSGLLPGSDPAGSAPAVAGHASRNPPALRTVVCAIHQPHYLPWLRYLDKIARADVFVLLDDAQFNKNGWQNRNRLKGPQGPFTLTVPVRHRFAAPLLDVAIADAGFRRAHLAALRTSYGKAPGFDLLARPLAPLLAREWSHLVDLATETLGALLDLLHIRTTCLRSSALRVPGRATERLVAICGAVGATHYLTGAHAAGAYLEPERFAAAGLGLLVHEWTAPVYEQAFPAAGFVPDLSIVDLLAARGESARDVLASAGRVVAAG
jgi:hypothetical protein